MDVDPASRNRRDSSERVLMPMARRGPAINNSVLQNAQPVMAQHEQLLSQQIMDYDALILSLQDGGDITLRRRASSAGDAGVGERPGARERKFVCQIAKDIRKENGNGLNRASRDLIKLGYDRDLVDELIDHHVGYRRITRALAGGNARATDAQIAQAFALSIFDVNRLLFMQEVVEPEGSEGDASADSSKARSEQMKELVLGAKRVTDFSELNFILDMFVQMRLDAEGSDRSSMLSTLEVEAGMFQTNARRFLDAFVDAASGGHDDSLRQRLPTCLKKQWLKGIGEQEREALRGASAEEVTQFHRKLYQQYALLCRRFGLPMQPTSELILVDDDD